MPTTIGTLPESMLLAGDSPRARTTDPLTSHAAADRSQKTRPSVRRAVLSLVSQFENLSGEEINGFYSTRDDFAKVRYDSPRKRASELAADGYLLADRTDGLAAVYTLTDAGRVFLEEVAR